MREGCAGAKTAADNVVLRTPSPGKLFVSFLSLGLTAFGGPAMVAYIRDLAVGAAWRRAQLCDSRL